MSINIDGHDCELGDDGSPDTLIIVDGKEFRFTDTAQYKLPDGTLTDNGFEELCKQAIENLWQTED